MEWLTQIHFSYIYNLNASFHSVSSTVCPLLRSVKSYSSGVKFLRSYYTMCIGSSSFWRVLEWRAATNHIVATSLAAEAAAAALGSRIPTKTSPCIVHAQESARSNSLLHSLRIIACHYTRVYKGVGAIGYKSKRGFAFTIQ